MEDNVIDSILSDGKLQYIEVSTKWHFTCQMDSEDVFMEEQKHIWNIIEMTFALPGIK